MSIFNHRTKTLDDAQNETKRGNLVEVAKILHTHLGDCITFEEDLKNLDKEYKEFKQVLAQGVKKLDEIREGKDKDPQDPEHFNRMALTIVMTIKTAEIFLDAHLKNLQSTLKRRKSKVLKI